MSSAVSEKVAWRTIVLLSVVAAGLALADERRREPSQYFWDLSSYVTALDSPNPYKSDAVFAFLYPPSAAHLFSLARTHLFQLLSVAYVGAIFFFFTAFARIAAPRRYEWLFAITAMGGLGVVSLRSGNVAIGMNFLLLALLLDAAGGNVRSLRLLPLAVAIGSLIKPQFMLYLGLVAVLEPQLKTAVVKILMAALAVLSVHAAYALLRPELWFEYTASVADQMITAKDFGWGSGAAAVHVFGSVGAALAGFAVALIGVVALSAVSWRRTLRAGAEPPLVSQACLAFFILTFANPRVPLYDLYAAGIALAICCSFANRPAGMRAMIAALAINLVPFLVMEFANTPPSWPWWSRDSLLTHVAGLVLLLVALARTGLHGPVHPEASHRTA